MCKARSGLTRVVLPRYAAFRCGSFRGCAEFFAAHGRVFVLLAPDPDPRSWHGRCEPLTTMHPLPHRYSVVATGLDRSDIALESRGIAKLRSAAPLEFDGPGDQWSPETLLVAAVADCFVLTFRAVAHASQLPWMMLRCEVDGTLDRVERVLQFTRFDLRAELHVPPGVGTELAQRVLQKAERACLISNSLKAESHLETAVHIASAELEPALGQP